MKIVQYTCTHCGKRFEAEEREVLECPGCFWSTSVKKEEDLGGEPVSKPPSSASGARGPGALTRVLVPAAAVLLIAGAAVFLYLFVYPTMTRVLERAKKTSLAPEEKTPNSGGPQDQKKTPRDKKSSATVAPAPEVFGGLTADEHAALTRRLELSAERTLSPEEEKILAARVTFKTGFVERLPSQPWTLETFKGKVSEQETRYQIRLPGSYKRSLWKLFELHYLPGAEAFTAGDLMKARNLWIESLAFPIYANDVRKHRGVVLTMLKPFISDTLSKVAAINSSLVDNRVREKEKQIGEAYETLLAAVTGKRWTEALQAAGELEKKMAEAANPETLAGGPAAYPPALSQVDSDIRTTLDALLEVPPPTVADLEPLYKDLWQKRNMIQSLIPENLEKIKKVYEEGLQALQVKDWNRAEKVFSDISGPPELARDAGEKIRLIRKLRAAGIRANPLDSGAESG